MQEVHAVSLEGGYALLSCTGETNFFPDFADDNPTKSLAESKERSVARSKATLQQAVPPPQPQRAQKHAAPLLLHPGNAA
jgi:hypothetical protein